MNKFFDIVLVPLAILLVFSSFVFINGFQDRKIAAQAVIIEQLQGDVKAMTSAFKEMSVELLRVHTAYASWSEEIEKLRDARDAVPKIPEIGRWRNRKKTRGINAK